MKKKYITIFMILAVLALSGSAIGKVLFSDNFDSYAALTDNSALADMNSAYISPWVPVVTSEIKVGSLWPGLAYYSGNDSTDKELRMYRAVLDESLANYTVEMDVMRHPDYLCNWLVGARITDTAYIVGGAVLGNADPETGKRPIYAKMYDSDGDYIGDYWVAIHDANEPIHIVLTVNGDQATLTVTHFDYTKTISYTTTVLDAGDPGFGGQWDWGYSKGYYDNFVVSQPVCGDPGTVYNAGDLNKDCVVDFYDFAMLVSQWLECTDPEDPTCIQY